MSRPLWPSQGHRLTLIEYAVAGVAVLIAVGLAVQHVLGPIVAQGM